jgi:hypothetical protein
MQQRTVDITTQARHLEDLAPRALRYAGILLVLGAAGALGLAFSQEHGLERLLQTYLVSYTYYLSLALGGLFFVMLQHVTRAGWSVVVRRLAEGIATNVMLMAALAVPLVLGMHHIYHWSHADAVAHDPLLAAKAGFLNPTFFTIRLAVYFLVWSLLAWFFFRTSTTQDTTGDPALTRRMETFAAPGLVLFALSINFAAFDLLMSVDPHWFSTIFGVYYFAGSVVVTMATLPPILAWLQRNGKLNHVVTIEHYHDLGKLLFGFTVFWAYIAFSQYMLYWYGNVPEETQWYLKRQTGDWTWVSLALLFGHFVIPFFALISRYPKRRPRLLVLACLWMVAMHWLDLFYLVGPEFSPESVQLGLIDLFCFIGLGGLFFAVLALRLRPYSLVPQRDPRLAESMRFENA